MAVFILDELDRVGACFQIANGARVCDPQQLRQAECICNKLEASWSLDVAAAEDGRAPKVEM